MSAALWDDCLAELCAWLCAAYPNEGCGLIVERKGQRRFVPLPNLAADPRTAYVLDPLEFVRAEDRGEAVIAIVHSHVDSPAHFSGVDARDALLARPNGPEPAFPGVDYLVISVSEGHATDAALFRFAREEPGRFTRIGHRRLA